MKSRYQNDYPKLKASFPETRIIHLRYLNDNFSKISNGRKVRTADSGGLVRVGPLHIPHPSKNHRLLNDH